MNHLTIPRIIAISKDASVTTDKLFNKFSISIFVAKGLEVHTTNMDDRGTSLVSD